MTPPQHKKYIRDWAGCAQANGWKMVKGRLVMNEARLNDHGRKVHAAAVQRAGGEHRAPVLEDLRHGIHVVALGRDKSSKTMNNRETDAVFALFKLLVNECDIAADQDLSNPDRGELKRLLIRIHRLGIPDAIILKICANSFAPVFNGTQYEDLPLPSLRALCGILTEIRERKDALRNETPELTPHPGPLPIAPLPPQRGEGDVVAASVSGEDEGNPF